MNHPTFIREAIAMLLCMLASLFAVEARAQTGAQVQTISNTAAAQWSAAGSDHSIVSNTASFSVVLQPITIDTFAPAFTGGQSVSFIPSHCGGAPIAVPGAPSGSAAVASVARATTLHIGDVLYFRLVSPAANLNASAIDSVTAVLTTSSGDRETVEVFETAPDSGVFLGAVPTSAIPPRPVSGDCRLSVAAGDRISIECTVSGKAILIATAEIDVLADPFGLIFDSEDGSPVNGAKVSLVDALTGAPARVFGDDGVTPYPAIVYSGQPATDSAGNVYPMLPGEYRFPLAALGQYRVLVEPPAPYGAPSKAGMAELSALTRPDGQPLILNDASFGGLLALASLAPVRVDVPVDRPSAAVTLRKSVSRLSAVPGDVVFYTVTASNPDISRTRRSVVMVDTASPWLRLRRDSVRIDGAPAPGAVQAMADGRTLIANLGDIGPGLSRTVTYAMTLRADAPPGQAVNRATATDSRGNQSAASAVLRIERETIAGRMTLIGRISSGDCAAASPRPGIAGVRVMLEDGSYAITDADGRYHFDGLVPGTHVAQAQLSTLPAGSTFANCADSSRFAGNPASRFVTGQGGSLTVADFYANVPKDAKLSSVKERIVSKSDSSRAASGAETDWLAMGDGPTDFLFPSIDHNPRAPAVRVVIRHRVGQKVALSIDGAAADPVSFDGQRSAPGGGFAVSIWRGIALGRDVTHLTATVRNADGSVAASLARDVYFAATPARAEILPGQSHLIADGSSRPVIAVRIVDRRGHPVHAGLTGTFSVGAPYESAAVLDAMQARALSGQNRAEPSWTVSGDDGVALIELAPTMVSGALHLGFTFSDDEVRRSQELSGWIVPGEQKWTLVGLAEGSAGSQSVADNMERSGRFDSDLGNHARLAFYAKGRVLGRFLLTAAYDSAKQRDDQRLLGAIDPGAYYTVFADGSDRRFDAASRNKLYVRIESAHFYALFGDFDTGFDQAQLARYQRTTTGIKAEARSGAFHAQAFAARIAATHRRDEIQGGGISGPYHLASRAMIPNSEVISIEVRDRFRSELVLDRKVLTRFIDYDIDLLAGTITFKQPLLSRDAALNPQFIVADYEVDFASGGAVNAGMRGDVALANGALRLGASLVTDKGEGARTDLAAVDIKARLSAQTELRAEAAASRAAGTTSQAWLIEAEHHGGKLDVLAYARSADSDFGLGQQNAAERGRRKFGVDTRYTVTSAWSIAASAWHDASLVDSSQRRALQLRSDVRSAATDARLVFTSFNDRLADGRRASSNVIEGGITRRLMDNRLELDAASSVALGNAGSVDLPSRYRLGARFAITPGVKLVGSYEIAESDLIRTNTARGGFEVTPWTGARAIAALGQQSISESGARSFAAFGLAQSLDLTSHLTIDASIDSNHTLSGIDPARIVNAAQPVASGGNLGDNGSLSEDFTAITLGGAYRAGRWSATLRGEWRGGQLADRKGVTFGAIRQLGEGSMVGSGFTWTRATAPGGASSEVFDGAIAAAHRPASSSFAFLTKLQFRADAITGAVAGEAGPAGRTALAITGDARSRRLIGSVSANWSPTRREEGRLVQRSELGVFTAVRYNLDSYQGFDLAGVTVLGGMDARIGMGDRFELGAVATVRSNLSDHTVSYAIGPQIGFTPGKDVLLTVGYNVSGFRDRDFSAARTTDKGFFAALRMKFDADSFAFLGLGQ